MANFLEGKRSEFKNGIIIGGAEMFETWSVEKTYTLSAVVSFEGGIYLRIGEENDLSPIENSDWKLLANIDSGSNIQSLSDIPDRKYDDLQEIPENFVLTDDYNIVNDGFGISHESDEISGKKYLSDISFDRGIVFDSKVEEEGEPDLDYKMRFNSIEGLTIEKEADVNYINLSENGINGYKDGKQFSILMNTNVVSDSKVILPQVDNKILLTSVNDKDADINGNIKINLQDVVSEGNIINRRITFRGEENEDLGLEYNNEDESLSYIYLYDNPSIELGVFSSDAEFTYMEINDGSIEIGSDKEDFKGLNGKKYYGENYDVNSYIQRKYVEDNFLPLSGSSTGKVMTGGIEFYNPSYISLYFGNGTNVDNSTKSTVFGTDFNNNQMWLKPSFGTLANTFFFLRDDAFNVNMAASGYGLVGSSYYGAQYGNNSFIQKKYVDDNFLLKPSVAGTNGQVLTTNGAGSVSWTTVSGGSGTVTSIGLTAPTGFSVSNSPITTSGDLGLTYASGYQGYTTAEANIISGATSDVLDEGSPHANRLVKYSGTGHVNTNIAVFPENAVPLAQLRNILENAHKTEEHIVGETPSNIFTLTTLFTTLDMVFINGTKLRQSDYTKDGQDVTIDITIELNEGYIVEFFGMVFPAP